MRIKDFSPVFYIDTDEANAALNFNRGQKVIWLNSSQIKITNGSN
ncbi:MAG: hypothetical protein Q8N22_00895 [bacterium]|nr:hypothetical protein [bacterium]